VLPTGVLLPWVSLPSLEVPLQWIVFNPPVQVKLGNKRGALSICFGTDIVREGQKQSSPAHLCFKALALIGFDRRTAHRFDPPSLVPSPRSQRSTSSMGYRQIFPSLTQRGPLPW